MKGMKQRIVALVVALSMVFAFTLTGCSDVTDVVEQVADDAATAAAQFIEGNVTGEVGQEYETKWFKFTVDSMEVSSTYGDYTAADGNNLLIAHITETNNSGSSQPFGTFDWFIDESSLDDYIYPLDPLNDEMMPIDFRLADGETASYDVVIEYPASLASPFLMYIEADDQGQTYTTFKIPVN